MTDENKEKVKEAIERTKDAAATLAAIAPSNETIAAAGIMNGLSAIANRPDERKSAEKSPEEKALEEIKKANKGATTIAGLVAAEQKATESMEKVDKELEKKAKDKDKDKGKVKDNDKSLMPQKDNKQKPEDEKNPKEKEDDEKKDDKKKTSSQKYEEEMKKRYSRIDLPSGMYIKAEGQSWNLYDKNNNCMDVTSQMNQLIAHNKGVDEANQAQEKRAGQVKVDENDLPIRGNQLKNDMVESSINKINTGDLKPEKDTFDLKKLEAPDIKKLAEIAVDRAFDENNLKLLRELEEKKKENENRKDKDRDGKDERSSDAPTVIVTRELGGR